MYSKDRVNRTELTSRQIIKSQTITANLHCRSVVVADSVVGLRRVATHSVSELAATHSVSELAAAINISMTAYAICRKEVFVNLFTRE